MDLVCFLYVSLGCDTFQLHDGLGNRRACAVKETVSGVKMATVVEECTGKTQKNGAVSKVNKKCISHPTRAQHTLSAAATVQVSHALIVILQCVYLGSHDTHPHGKLIPYSVQYVRC
jgi:hypothetical protein